MEWIYRPTQIYCLYAFSHPFTMQNIWYYIYPCKGLYINSNIGQQLDLVPYFSLLFLSFASVWLTQHADEFSKPEFDSSWITETHS